MDSSGLKVKTVAKINSEPSTSTTDGSVDVKPQLSTAHATENGTKKRKRQSKESKITPDKSIPQLTKTPRPRKNRKLNQETPSSSGKKISDYFQKAPQVTPSSSVKRIADYFSPVKVNSTDSKENGDDYSSIKGKMSRIIEPKVEKVKRKLCPGTDLKLVSNRYHDDTQSRLSNFYDKTKTNDFGYFTTVESSKMPAINDGSMDVEAWLDISIREGGSQPVNINPIESAANITETLDRIQNLALDEADLERQAWNMEENLVPVENMADVEISSEEDEDFKPIKKKKKAPKRRKVICPKYKVIAGTTFAVDAFRFGKIAGVTHYFLTHFHSDHYIGLSKKFEMPIICSSITSRLAQKCLKVSSKLIQVVDINETIEIDGVKITAVDANHCPGAVMFIFKLSNGRTILHTGDFRATPEMESLPIFWNNNIDEIYLDTTYYSTKYELMSQSDCILRCLNETRSYREKHFDAKILICVGSYVIGKEKVWKSIAKEFNLKVWVEKKRRMAIDEYYDRDINKYLVDDPKDAGLHVVNLGIVNYDDLKSYLNNFPDHFTHVLGIRPSGWEKKSRPRHQGNISIVGVEYSEHSSYSEIKRFLRFLRPSTVISTVPTSSNPNSIPPIPRDWYAGEIKPERHSIQVKMDELLLKTADKKPILSAPLNASAKVRRQETNERIQQFKIVETINLDSEEETNCDSQDTDVLL